ncbi:putative thioesterase family protein [Golovinomyces cichoracearum]|uniref:Putative thioesterase family protein n=1 Tax=Golovinomyces cichoracearum TaxID=62708 RepID=A0A420I939_9PEZI|nr:putative thioesterase family protein [Golovinomyces cichoracearum]
MDCKLHFLKLRCSTPSNFIRPNSCRIHLANGVKRQQRHEGLFFNFYSTPYSTGPEIDKKQERLHANLRSQIPSSKLSIPSIPQPSTTPDTCASSRDGKKRTKKSYLRPYIYAALFFAIGTLAGNFVCTIIIPPVPPEPESLEDRLMIEYLHTQAEKLPLVQSLRSDGTWTNVNVKKIGSSSNETGAENDNKEGEKERLKRRLTIGPLAGSRALGGYQQIFRNSETGEIINIVWFGAALSGWPGVTHGGLLATVLDETLGRCAMGFLESRTAVTANLQLDYLKPVLTNGFFVIRTTPLKEDDKQKNVANGEAMEKYENKKVSHSRKQWVTGSLETVTGDTCVRAKALFVVPKQYKLK